MGDQLKSIKMGSPEDPSNFVNAVIHKASFDKCKSYIDAAKKSKEARVQVILECTEHKESGMPGTSRYITVKNRKNTPARMELKKYNSILKKVTVHKEIK